MKCVHDNLMLLGVPKTVALVVEVLADGTPHSLHEIENAADLRQSEVSIAVRCISDYITTVPRSCVNKGRPQKIVQMSRESYLRYVTELRETLRKKFKDAMQAGSELMEARIVELEKENKRMKERGE